MAVQLRDHDGSVGMNTAKSLSLREIADSTRRESAPPPTKFGETIEGISLLNGAKSIAGFLHDALPWQILGDELAYGYGEAACTAQAFGGW